MNNIFWSKKLSFSLKFKIFVFTPKFNFKILKVKQTTKQLFPSKKTKFDINFNKNYLFIEGPFNHVPGPI